jgi:CBS domain-containing protein
MDQVRDAMVSDPPMLGGDATAREAAEALGRPEVRAVFVCDDDGRLLGVVTRKTLVREIVAAGRDPSGTELREIVEVPLNTIGSELPLDEAFRFLEEHDLERVPVLEEGRLVGVLSRAVLQRRLAEDEPPVEPVSP